MLVLLVSEKFSNCFTDTVKIREIRDLFLGHCSFFAQLSRTLSYIREKNRESVVPANQHKRLKFVQNEVCKGGRWEVFFAPHSVVSFKIGANFAKWASVFTYNFLSIRKKNESSIKTTRGLRPSVEENTSPQGRVLDFAKIPNLRFWKKALRLHSVSQILNLDLILRSCQGP